MTTGSDSAQVSHGGDLLDTLVKQCLTDSQRWFPDVCPKPEDSRRQTISHLIHHTVAMFGEVGEFANLLKKVERGTLDFDNIDVRQDMSEELTDVLIYLLNLAGILKVDLLAEYNRKRVLNEARFGDDDN